MFTSRAASASCAVVGAPTAEPDDGTDEVDAVEAAFDPPLHDAITSAAVSTTNIADDLCGLTGNARVGAISPVRSFDREEYLSEHTPWHGAMFPR